MTMATGGIRGDFADSCTVCMKGTDTGLAFVGEAEWIMAGMVRMGIPIDQVPGTFGACVGSAPGMVPVGRLTVTVRACVGCANLAGLPVDVIAVGSQIPSYVQPEGPELTDE